MHHYFFEVNNDVGEAAGYCLLHTLAGALARPCTGAIHWYWPCAGTMKAMYGQAWGARICLSGQTWQRLCFLGVLCPPALGRECSWTEFCH